MTTFRIIISGVFAAAVAAQAGQRYVNEHFSVLKAGIDTYSNVTVTIVTDTDIYFTYPHGMGNAKIWTLNPKLRSHFAYNAAAAAQANKAQAQADSQYRQQLLQSSPPSRQIGDTSQTDPAADFVAPQLYARSIRGQRAPEFVVERWLTDPPDSQGKFVLIDFWATWCGPCRRSIPELDEFYARFRGRLVVIGVSDESEADIRKMTDPQIDYAVASDPQRRMFKDLQITGIPHSILIDPHGIVRYEGMPNFLDDDKLQHFLDKYGN